MRIGRFIVGLGIGAIAGALLAPKKGSELRADLKTTGTDVYNTAKNMTKEDVQDIVNSTIDDLKKAIDEFDMEEFKDTSGKKLSDIKTKLEELAATIQDSDEYAQFKDSVKNVSDEIGNKLNEIKLKVQEQDFVGMEALEEGIDELEDELDVIIEDLRD